MAGTTANYVYKFPGAPNSANHSLTGRPGLVWSYNFSANDDANNFIYRMKLKFVWSNPSSSVTRTIATRPASATDRPSVEGSDGASRPGARPRPVTCTALRNPSIATRSR